MLAVAVVAEKGCNRVVVKAKTTNAAIERPRNRITRLFPQFIKGYLRVIFSSFLPKMHE